MGAPLVLGGTSPYVQGDPWPITQASARAVNEANHQDSVMTSHVPGGKAESVVKARTTARGRGTTSRKADQGDYLGQDGCHHRRRQHRRQARGLDQSIRIEMFGDLHEYGALGRVVTKSEALAAV